MATQIATYQIHCSLVGSCPAVWRRILVPADVRLSNLHAVLQVAVGWLDYHQYTFKAQGKTYVSAEMSIEDSGRSLDARKCTLSGLMEGTGEARYCYDMGDWWEHRLLLERSIEGPYPRLKQAVLLAGENAGPPEDCGGVHGYAELIAAMAKPSSERARELREWLGGDWDPTALDIGEKNLLLARVKL